MSEDNGSPFDSIFRDFFGPSHKDGFEDFARQMEEMMEQINTMFQNPGEVDVSVGYHPPPWRGNRQPPYRESPRDAMLKEPDESGQSVITSADITTPVSTGQGPPEPFIFSRRFKFPVLFGPGPEMPGSFGTREQPNVPSMENNPSCESCQDSVSWSSSSSFSSQMFGGGSGWTGTQIRTVHHPDGSVERIEKKTEHGRTCTTVTRTDPNGVTSSSTTCDRPAIGDSSRPGSLPSDSNKVPEMPGYSKPGQPAYLPLDKDMKPEDSSFFSKLFGFKFFKPRDE